MLLLTSARRMAWGILAVSVAAPLVSLSSTVAPAQTCSPLDPAVRTEVVLVLDGSRAMVGNPADWLAAGAARFLTVYSGCGGPATVDRRQAAVVRYNSSATVLCPMTSDLNRLRVCVKRVGARGDSRLASGLAAAHRILRRDPGAGGADIRQSIVVVSGSRPTREISDILELGRFAEVDEPDIYAVCLEPGCAPTVLRQAIGTSGRLFAVSGPSSIPAALSLIAALITSEAASIYLPFAQH